MRTAECTYALQNLIRRKTRSALTILSIVIGVTAIFTLISFGLGIQDYISIIAEKAGTDKLFIQSKGIGAPGTDENFFITQDNVNIVKKVKGVQDATAMYIKTGEIEHKKQKKLNFLMGMDSANDKFVAEAVIVDIAQGRALKKGDINQVVLGYNYQIKDKIFKTAVALGDKIRISDDIFEVVGFYSSFGNPPDDATVYLTHEAIEKLFPSAKGKFAHVVIKAAKNVDTQNLAERIKEKLRKHKNQEKGKEDFYVRTLTDLLATFSTITLVINGVLILIAVISVIVATINITNTMYTAVLERTKEIGTIKAIGGKPSHIAIIFITESGMLGILGGILGVLLGYILASTGGAIAASAGYSILQPIFPSLLIIGCIIFAFLIGAAAGLLPALQAAKLNPVEALRYE